MMVCRWLPRTTATDKRWRTARVRVNLRPSVVASPPALPADAAADILQRGVRCVVEVIRLSVCVFAAWRATLAR